jgi:SAM-dependent methyltransferase
VLKDPYRWQELKTGSFDVFISGQTFEHIEYFWVTMLEIVRILKPGGVCCLIAPSGGYSHRYPVDCWRFYSDGFAALARFADMELMEVFTDVNSEKEYTDESNQWKDTVMVCRKPRQSVLKTWCRAMRRWILHRLLR